MILIRFTLCVLKKTFIPETFIIGFKHSGSGNWLLFFLSILGNGVEIPELVYGKNVYFEKSLHCETSKLNVSVVDKRFRGCFNYEYHLLNSCQNI